MLTIKIHNDGTGTNESANYTYRVYVNTTLIDHGIIKKHDRKKGWKKLLEKEWTCLEKQKAQKSREPYEAINEIFDRK